MIMYMTILLIVFVVSVIGFLIVCHYAWEDYNQWVPDKYKIKSMLTRICEKF